MAETLQTDENSEKNEPRLIWAAVILTLLFPGLGHIYCGEPKRGIGLYLSAIISVSALFILCGLFPNPVTMILLFTADIFFFIYFIYDAVRITKLKKIYYLKNYNKWYLYPLFILLGSFFMSSIYLPLIKKNIIDAYSNPTGSMENTMLPGDHFFVNKFTYKIGESKPKRNDVVIFELEGMRDEVVTSKKVTYVKRIAGIPGDTLKLINYLVYINGSLQPTPAFARLPAITYDHINSNPNIFPKGSHWNEENYGPVIIPKRNDIIHLNVENIDGWRVFIERENHSISLKDSTILIDNIPAAEYKVQRNYYFTLGDTRENSLDSRFFGFVPEEDILGQPTIVYWSSDPTIPMMELSRKLSGIRWDRIGIEIK